MAKTVLDLMCKRSNYFRATKDELVIPFYDPVCDTSFTKPDFRLPGFRVVVGVMPKIRELSNLKRLHFWQIIALAIYLDSLFLFDILKCEESQIIGNLRCRRDKKEAFVAVDSSPNLHHDMAQYVCNIRKTSRNSVKMYSNQFLPHHIYARYAEFKSMPSLVNSAVSMTLTIQDGTGYNQEF